MNFSTNFKAEVTELLHLHNPMEVTCLSEYGPIIDDLLKYWRFDDSTFDLHSHLKVLFSYHTNTRVEIPTILVSELYELRQKIPN